MTSHELEVLALSTAKLVKSVVAEATAPLLVKIAELEARAAVPGPAGPVGPSGERGEKGDPGQSVSADELDSAIHAAQAPLLAQIAALTTRMAGMETKGVDVVAGPPGPVGPSGEPGAKGRDGVGIADALIDKDHSLVLTLTDGTVKKLGVVVGRDGVNGQKGDPGRDGFGFDDLAAEFDGDRLLTLAFVRGEDRKAFPVELPHTIYRGVFADGTVYQRGDAVTWGGSLWIAKERTTDKPEVSKAWQLAVKRGRDGREGKSGPEGPRGPKGDKGDR
jgi:hypothetical protein